MTPDDKTLIGLLLDGEADADQIKAALALLDEKPELMDFFQRQQWLRAHWKQEHLGPPVDLTSRIWETIDAEPVAAVHNEVVDELAVRREAKLADQLGVESADVSGTESQAQSTQQSKQESLHVDQPPKQASANDSSTQLASTKTWWHSLAQGSVAAAVCMVLVGLWYVQPNEGTVSPGAQPIQVVDAQQPGVQRPSSTVERESIRLEDYDTLDGARLVVAGGTQAPVAKGSVEAGILLASDSHESQFVSLEKLRQEERARLADYYMMHTGNSALLEPIQGMQLVRIVDSPLSHPAQTPGNAHLQRTQLD